MRIIEGSYLFYRTNLDAFLKSKEREIVSYIEGLNKESFLDLKVEELIENGLKLFQIVPLTIHDDEMHRSDPVETDILIQSEHRRNLNIMGGRSYIDGFIFDIEVPYTGCPGLWQCKPNHYSSRFPMGKLKDEGSNEGLFTFPIEVEHDAEPEQVEKLIRDNINLAKQYSSYSVQQIKTYNDSIGTIIKNAVESREGSLGRQQEIMKFLNIPLKKKVGMPDFKPIKVERKITNLLEIPGVEEHEAEPGIRQEVYEDILRILRHGGISFEKTARTFSKFNEEELRDVLLSHLNTVYEGGAKGEVFNKKGKTDILIEDKERNAFIAECKIWKGQKEFTKAIDQLFGYLTWRDCKTALIIFNKNIDGFAGILGQIETIVEEHTNYQSLIELGYENEWLFSMTQKDDENRTLQMNVMIYNLVC